MILIWAALDCRLARKGRGHEDDCGQHHQGQYEGPDLSHWLPASLFVRQKRKLSAVLLQSKPSSPQQTMSPVSPLSVWRHTPQGPPAYVAPNTKNSKESMLEK